MMIVENTEDLEALKKKKPTKQCSFEAASRTHRSALHQEPVPTGFLLSVLLLVL